MPKILISYRRGDSEYPAREIYKKLVGHYGASSVVFDVETIPKGFDFVKFLDQQVRQCDVLLAVIGDQWLEVQAWCDLATMVSFAIILLGERAWEPWLIGLSNCESH